MKNTIKYDLEKYKTELCAQYEKIEFAQQESNVNMLIENYNI